MTAGLKWPQKCTVCTPWPYVLWFESVVDLVDLAPFTPFVWIDRTAGVKISSKLKSVTMKQMLKAATCLLVMSHASRVWRSKRLFLLCKRLCSGILQKYKSGLFFTGGHTHWLYLKRVEIGKWTGLTLRISPPTHSHKFTHQWVAELRVELLTAQPYNTTTLPALLLD